MNNQENMNKDDKFEQKLKMLVEKYGKRTKKSKKHSNQSHFFNYEKVKKNVLLADKDDKYIYAINIYDDEFVDILKDIYTDPNLFDDEPSTTTDGLYYSINIIRKKYDSGNNQDEHVKRIYDFVNELFGDKYTKMDNLIKTGIIDFDSLWYYIDNSNAIYKIKYQTDDICFKYDYFNYVEDKDESLVLYGKVIYPTGGNLSEANLEFKIKKFTGTKNINSLKISMVDNDTINLFMTYGEKILLWYKSIKHMFLNGKQYVNKDDTIYCFEKNERVMVDYEGLEKYANLPFDFEFEKMVDENTLNRLDKAIIFPFVSVYNLGMNKTWGFAHIKSLVDITYDVEAFDSIILDANKKNIIKSLINQHHKTSTYNDFIAGKGNGLVFLLYGPPGTGKTLTAEATSEHLKRPLYSINVSDLGTDPEHMEMALNRTIEYVARWGAIVLIDEVDIFLEERESSMIIRNALVAVFLKLLEYHNGIIFLTTNRLKSLDIAVKSRINLMLSYKEFTSDKREKIWLKLFEKWNLPNDKNIIKDLCKFDLNGREIRNYIKLIIALHESNNKEMDGNSILKYMNECYELTNEFNDDVKSINLYS